MAGLVAAAERMAGAVWKGPLLLKAMSRIVACLAAICVRLQVQEGFGGGSALPGPRGPLFPYGMSLRAPLIRLVAPSHPHHPVG